MKIRHKKNGWLSEADGEQLIELKDGERWKLENVEVIGEVEMKNKIKRKVVCVFGKFDEKSDFVLEPPCSDGDKCEVCGKTFWIEECEE